MSKTQRSNSNPIKAVILDIDGVVVGGIDGVNFPHPSVKIKEALLKIRKSGLYVSFLTGKGTFAAIKNTREVGLDNAHIADGGATIFNSITGEIIESKAINAKIVRKLLSVLPPETYINVFTPQQYFLQRNHQNSFTPMYSRIAMKEPTFVESMGSIINDALISKINIATFSDQEKKLISDITAPFENEISFGWTRNPTLPGINVLIATALGVSKKSGVKSLAKHLGVSLDSILAVGDNMHDWEFIEECGYRAAMGNGSAELKGKIDLTDPDHQMIGGHVDEDGLIKVFEHFKLL